MSVLVETRFGAMECLAGDSVVSRSLALYGEWAQHEIALAARWVRPGDVVLDVGAFLGTHTLAFAQMVGHAGKVHSFEPRQAIRTVLQGNVRRNALDQVEVHGCALGEQPGHLRIGAVDTEEAQNFGGLAIQPAADDGAGQTETIELRTLDSLELERVDFIKIDAEGMEADVLAGGAQTLTRFRPLVLAECNDLQQGSRTWRVLRELGYDVYGFVLPAFAPDNFRSEALNIFGDAAEVSLLAVHPDRQAGLDVGAAAPIDSLDTLALLLLHKPQYPEEAWGRTDAGSVLGMAFHTPFSRQLQGQLQGQLDEAAQSQKKLQDSLVDLRQKLAELQSEAERLRSEKEKLAQYLPSSLLYRWHRFRSAGA